MLDRAYEEALLALSPEVLAFYNQSLSDMIYDLSINWDTITIIDSPLQNLSLFRDALDGVSVLSSLGVTTSADTLLSVFIGVASDKTLPVTTDTVIAVSTILGMPLSEAQSEAIAVDADAVRIAVLAGHG